MVDIERIAIIGISGVGKSVCGRRLAALTGLPLYHMDQLFWRGNWALVPEAEYLEKHAELIKKERWIIEGYVDEAMAERLSRADMIIYLDYSGLRAAWQVFRRWLMHRKVARPELHADARERLRLWTFWKVLTRMERIPTEAAIKIAGNRNLQRFHSPKELQRFTHGLERQFSPLG